MTYRTGGLVVIVALAITLLTSAPARMDDGVRVLAAGRGGPFVNFEDGVSLGALGVGGAADTAGAPLALASGDLDDDGVPDLVVAHGAGGRGAIVVYRGNADAIYPPAGEPRRRQKRGLLPAAPFHGRPRAFDLGAVPDFVGVGDFDADGRLDVVAAARAGRALHWLRGDRQGGLQPAPSVPLTGRITALATGEVNRVDGLADIAVAVVTARGPKALVLESPRGALRATPESFDLPAAAAALALGRIDADRSGDLAVGAGKTLVMVHGRDRKLTLDEDRKALVAPAAVSRRTFSSTITALAIGDFVGDHGKSIAALTADGRMQTLARPDLAGFAPISMWPVVASRPASPNAQLVAAKVSSAPASSGRHRELGVAREQRTVVGPADRRRRLRDRTGRLRSRRRLGPLANDLEVQRAGLGLGLGAELALQHAHAHLVLTERGSAPALAGVETHERAVHGLLERVQSEQAQGGLDGGVGIAGARVMPEQPGERPERDLVQPLALGEEPVLERRRLSGETGEEGTAIELGGARERLRRSALRQPLERPDVDVDGVAVDPDRVDVGDHGRRAVRQRLSDGDEGLPETGAHRALARVAPQQRCELAARVGLVGMQGQVGEQRLRLLARQHDGAAIGQLGLEPAQEPQPEQWVARTLAGAPPIFTPRVTPLSRPAGYLLPHDLHRAPHDRRRGDLRGHRAGEHR